MESGQKRIIRSGPCNSPLRNRDLSGIIRKVTGPPSAQAKRRAVDELIEAPGLRTPMVSEGRALFLHRGEAESHVSVAGDFNNWDAGADPMIRVQGTDLFLLEVDLPPDARIEYKLVVDGEWLLDSLNPNTVTSKFGVNSVLMMPEYEEPLDAPAQTEACCALRKLSLRSRELGSTWEARVRSPLRAAPEGLMVVLGGSDYMKYGNIDRITDWMISSGKVRPFVTALMESSEAQAEYEMARSCCDFVAEELIPFLKDETGASPEASQIAVLGAGYGGLISLLSALTFPGTIGKAAVQSGYFTGAWHGTVMESISALRKAPSVYMDCGAFETNVDGKGSILHASREVEASLKSRGCRVLYLETREGHNWTAWKGRLPRALEFLYGTR